MYIFFRILHEEKIKYNMEKKYNMKKKCYLMFLLYIVYNSISNIQALIFLIM